VTQSIGSVEEEWESFRGIILRRSEEVSGLRTVGAGGRKSEWWFTEMAVAVREKRGICLVSAEKIPRE
jgi:hypothetical protein